MFDTHGTAYQEIWKPARDGRRLEKVDIGPRIVVPEEGDWKRWKRLASKREVDAINCMPSIGIGMSVSMAGNAVSPSAVRLSYLLTNAILKLDPTNASVAGTWTNTGTAGASLTVTQATPGKQPVYGAATGKNGGPGLTFTAASSQDLQSGAYAWNQPSTIIGRVQFASATTGYSLCDGTGTNSRRVYVQSATTVGLHAGTPLGMTATPTAWNVIAGVFNGASSAVSVNGGAQTTGNAGTAAASGVTVGAWGAATGGYMSGVVDWLLGWDFAATLADTVLINTWLGLR